MRQPNTVVIAGASGIVGARVLAHLLTRDDVGHVVALGRRLLPLQHPKLTSTVVDLQDTAAVAATIPQGVAAAFCCLGSTIKQAGSKEAFRAVDYDAVLNFADAALDRGATRFLLVSALGANAASANFYQRTKGEAEQAVTRLGYAQVTVLRPSLIDDEGARSEYRRGERLLLPIARKIFALIGPTRRYAPIPAKTIATAMVHLAFDDTAERVRIVESEELHQLGHTQGPPMLPH